MSYWIEPKFKRRLEKKPTKMQAAILETIEKLEQTPWPPGLAKPFRSQPGVWEAKVDRGNRLTFRLEGNVRVMLNHCNHDMLRTG